MTNSVQRWCLLKARLVLVWMLGAMLLAGNATAGIWFKGEAAIKDNVSNVEKHRFYVKWMLKARGDEDAMTLQMTVRPDSPVFNKLRQDRSAPMELLFDMLDGKGKNLGEMKFIVPRESWEWEDSRVAWHLRKWDRNFYYSSDWRSSYRKVIMLYFHGFFTPPKECITLFLKTVRTSGEDVYYDLGNAGPKIVSNRLKSSIDKRSIPCSIEVNASVGQGIVDEDASDEGGARGDSGMAKYQDRSRTSDETVAGQLSESLRSLREQLRDQKSQRVELQAEVKKLQRQNEQLRTECEHLKDDAARMKRASEARVADLKNELEMSRRDAREKQNLEQRSTESLSRIKELEDEARLLGQENQMLSEKLASAGSWRMAYIGIIAVLLGLLVIVGICKFSVQS